MATQNMPGVSFITMGCAKNEVDSAHMASRLKAAGYRILADAELADVVIVNTCSFIQAATEESIEAILDASEMGNVVSGDAHLVVSGCMPSRYADDLAGELPEVSCFLPCADEENVVSVVDGLLGVQRIGEVAAIGESDGDGANISEYVKISDGCNRFCSYCTIPFIRGRYRSFSRDEIAAEVDRLVAGGTREVVLIAQDTGRWGDDFDPPETLAGLVSFLAERHPDTWFRLMYIQPEGITDELIEAVARHENVCSYFDIPFQHCDPLILKSMNRRGSRESYLDLIRRIRERVADVTLRTTLIAGYPGETDEQFEQLCDFVEEAELDYVGVFAYSREEGTRAYSLEGQLDEDEKLARAQRLRDIADAVSTAIVSERVGKAMEVLVLGAEEDGQLFGRAACQAPDVDGVTYLDSGEPGQFVCASIADTLVYEMEGEVIR